jgi:hypothetical protein
MKMVGIFIRAHPCHPWFISSDGAQSAPPDASEPSQSLANDGRMWKVVTGGLFDFLVARVM